MYNEKIESLIAAALADGILTDKERQILIRRAVAEGIEADEFEMVLDARLIELQKRLAPPPPAIPPMHGIASVNTPEKRRSEKYGEVRKCPSCGANVEAGTARCNTCGYAFTNIAANSSSEKLAQQLLELEQQFNNTKDSIADTLRGRPMEVKKTMARASLISNFPVPPTKDDLLEFAVSMRSKWLNTQGAGYMKLEKDAYKAKYDECIEKIKIFFPGDKTFANILTSYEADKNVKLSITEKISRNPGKYGCYITMISIGMFILLLSILVSLL